MDNLEKYSLLFSDSFFTNLAIDNSTELVIHTIKIFNQDNPFLVIMIAAIGYFLSTIVNYGFGRVIYNVLAQTRNKKSKLSNNRINALKNSRYLSLILILSATPFFGKFIVLFAGFCRVGFVYTITLCSLAKIVYYCYLMLF